MSQRDYSLLAPGEKSWDERILEKLRSGVDQALLDENLKLSPDQRLKNMISVLESLERGFDRSKS